MSYPGDQPSSDSAGFPPGAVVGGKYVVERVLGRGGMGMVVAAQHLQLREPVALKFLHGEMAKRPSIVKRFTREAQAAARIKSEHVARVFDVGTHEGAPFIVMELLAGEDLHKLAATRGPLAWSEAALYIAQACDAVAEAHLYGIVHRDLKPANLFLTRRADGSPLVKVLDFGISKMAGEVDENLTATTDVLGSPLYMSPEQIESPRDVDGRADVWALGAILYKLLTGRAAFAAATAASSLAKIVKDPPPPLRPQRPDLPPELEALVYRCLDKDVRTRLQSAAELGRALAPFAGLVPAEGTAPGASYSQPAGRGPSRRPAALIGVGATVMLGAALSVWLVTSGARRTGAQASAPVSSSRPAESLGATGSVGAATSAGAAASAEVEEGDAAAAAGTAGAAAASSTAGALPSASVAAPFRPGKPGRMPTSRAPGDAFSDRL
jgi:serine/threonine protein kinase